MSPKKVCLFLGSPRKKQNTFQFSQAFLREFEALGWSVERHFLSENYPDLSPVFRTDLEDSSLFGILSPMYADFLPFPTIQVLETLTDKHPGLLKGKSLFGFSQCAFPFWKLNLPSLGAMEFFGRQNGMQWLGGLAYGGAGMMAGRPLESMGKRGQKNVKGIRRMVEAVVEGRIVPHEAQQLLEVNLPGWTRKPLSWFLNARVKKIQKQVGKDLSQKPSP